MVYSESCSRVQPVDHNSECALLFNDSLKLFNDTNRLPRPSLPVENDAQNNANTSTCAVPNPAHDTTICNCCTTYLMNCTSKYIEKIGRLLNDTKLWRPSPQPREAQSSKGV